MALGWRPCSASSLAGAGLDACPAICPGLRRGRGGQGAGKMPNACPPERARGRWWALQLRFHARGALRGVLVRGLAGGLSNSPWTQHPDDDAPSPSARRAPTCLEAWRELGWNLAPPGRRTLGRRVPAPFLHAPSNVAGRAVRLRLASGLPRRDVLAVAGPLFDDD